MSEANGPTRRGAVRASSRDLSQLLRIVGKPRWATPVLLALGFLSSLAETLGITLILLFLYLVSDRITEAGGGLQGRALGLAVAWFGSPTRLAVAILLLILARGALALVYSLISSSIGERISERVRNLIHQQYLRVAFGSIQQHEQSQLMEVLGTESWLVAQSYGAVTRLIINSCSIFVFAVFLLMISWKILLIAALGSVAISAILRIFSRPARDLGHQVKKIHQSLGEHMLMTLQALRTIRAYGQEALHQRRFVQSSAAARNASLSMIRLSSWIGPTTEIGYLGMLGTIVLVSGWWHISFEVTLAAVALLYRLQPHTQEFESNLLFLAQMQPQLRSVLEMIRSEDKEYPSQGTIALRDLNASIVFDHVSFGYDPSTPVLTDLSLEIPAGVTTALIGASGAGKTTIVNLLLRLYEPTSGDIMIDGTRLAEIRRDDWLSKIAVTGQDVDLVEGTVTENIRMAKADATEEEIIAAARSAGVSAFVEGLPDRYDTWIGQEGLRFSGGQRQRIGLARAVLRDPDLLILDEAMNALDTALEDQVRRAIDRQLGNRTILLITHRIDTAREAANVIWIENGRVISQGPASLVVPQYQHRQHEVVRASEAESEGP
ncbi:ABC transporter ATP-binding protein [Mesorhizobium sp. B4-1-4]|uniref:ABC transporter ATP-binding protein n=1 Tax=Mesorhizobium sp. B4-1-4 TaxID=2589888 RepID=UPI0011267A97|nr:ABC transporter ATP-binding protein [Mesorhizobium sp. B4-1-4]UCI34543.1 ABC transporter ATP-binding protein/permease [Mesorhizobium sp. B4-1-4]